MSRIIDFLKEIARIAFSGITAFFAVFGASLYLREHLKLEGDIGFILGFIYFFAVLIFVKIGMDYCKEVFTKNGKKK